MLYVQRPLSICTSIVALCCVCLTVRDSWMVNEVGNLCYPGEIRFLFIFRNKTSNISNPRKEEVIFTPGFRFSPRLTGPCTVGTQGCSSFICDLETWSMGRGEGENHDMPKVPSNDFFQLSPSHAYQQGHPVMNPLRS